MIAQSAAFPKGSSVIAFRTDTNEPVDLSTIGGVLAANICQPEKPARSPLAGGGWVSTVAAEPTDADIDGLLPIRKSWPTP